jgi:NAD+ synthase
MSRPLVPSLPPRAEETIHRFLRAHLRESNRSGYVIGLSGGIDSAIAARLARDAVGGKAVTGVLLPDAQFPQSLVLETEAYAKELDIVTRTLRIDEPEGSLRRLLPEVTDRVAWGNVKARVRMIFLYALSAELGALVLGTGNKSEILLGYFTKYGDGGVDVAPLGDLYKTQLRELAPQLQIPRAIQDRPPTAGLWEGQTDEAELGLPYEEIDRVLVGMERLYTEAEIVERTHLSAAAVRQVVSRVNSNRHKRRLPPIPKLSLRTVGIDWRD